MRYFALPAVKQSGYILLPVVLLISLVAAAAFMLNNESVLEISATNSSRETARAIYVAEAGLQHALWQVEQAGCGPYTDISSQTFGNHNYSATITPNNAGGLISTFNVAVSDDAWIKSDTPAQNYGNDAQLSTFFNFSPSTTQRTLYRYDIANAGIPAGAMVVSAVARIFVLDSNTGASVSTHQITADWTEATVTWDNINSDHDFSSVASIATGAPVGQYVDVNITSLVQGWLNGSIANQGIMLKTTSIGDLAQYTSKEYGTASQRPELVIKVADGSLANRVTVNSTGLLASGASHNLIRKDIPLYQPAIPLTLQPDAATGKDGWITETQTGWNYGAHASLSINSSSQRALIGFELGALPPGINIRSAELRLYQHSANSTGIVSVHTVIADWLEGSCTGPGCTADGVTWGTRDGTQTWVSPGVDHTVAALDSQVIDNATGWYSWDVTSAVSAWVNNQLPNNGFLLKGSDGFSGEFSSSDASDATLHPQLVINYACECGVTCQLPQGAGNVLLVVGDDVTLNPADSKKKAIIEAWGYTVNLIDDAADQATFDAALAGNDVAYISETVSGFSLGDKLANTSKGVVNEKSDQNDNLGLSDSGSYLVDDSLNIIDNSHFITALLPNGVIPISLAPMEGLVISGTPATGLQSLAELSGVYSLALVDTGGALGGDKNGVNAAGRRVNVPVGNYDKFNWDYLNNNGRLIVQRAIQWGTGNTAGAPVGNLLFVTADLIPTAQEQLRTNLIASWGYGVTLIADDDNQANFDTALANNDVVYVPESIDPTTLGTKLTAATIGIVNENIIFATQLGLGNPQRVLESEINILDNTHSITDGYTLGLTTIATSTQALTYFASGVAIDAQTLAATDTGTGTYNDSLVTVEAGGELSTAGNFASGKRVQLPWGFTSFDFNELNADGLTIMQRAIDWAAAPGVAVTCDADYSATAIASEFSTASYSQRLNRGVTYFPEGQVLNGVTSPVGGSWIAVGGSGIMWMVGMDGTELDGGYTTGLSQLEGVTFVPAANPGDPGHLAIVKGSTLYYSDLSLPASSSYSTHSLPFVSNAGGISYIDGGTYDGHLAVADESSSLIHIIDSSFNLVTSLATAGLLDAPEGIAHLKDSDKFLVIDTGLSAALVIDTSLTVSQNYSLTPFGLGAPTGAAAAIHPTSCDHFFGDRPNNRYAYLNAGGAGGTAPIAHWKLDETSGVTAVDSAGGHDGTLNNFSASAWGSGQIDGALDFDGTNDAIRVTHDDNLSLTETMTFIAWINASSFGSTYQTIVAKDDGGAGSNYWFGTWQQELDFGFFAGGFYREVFTTGLNLQPGTWYQLAATFDNTADEVRLYVDGSEVHSGTLAFSPTAVTADLAIGRSPDGEYWRGLLDDVRIYDTVLSASEIADLYTASGGGGSPTPLPSAGVVFESFTDAKATNNVTSLNVAKPGGTAAGDLLIAALATDGDSAPSFNPPSGWTAVSVGTSADNKVSFGVWWKIATSSEPSQYTFTWSGSEEAYGWISRFTGHDPSSPIYYDNGTLTNDNTSAPICQKLITPVDNMLILRLGGFDDDDVTVGNPGLDGHTAINMDESGGGNSSTSGGSGYMIQTTAGDTDFGWFQLTKNEQMRTVTLGIRPAP